MDRKFHKGEVVWAKVRGFPWWPGVVKHIALKRKKISAERGISEEKELKATVDFIGDNSHVELPLIKLEKFNSRFNEFSKTKKKSLIKSIIVAKKIMSGEVPFEKHIYYVKNKLESSSYHNSDMTSSSVANSNDSQACKEKRGDNVQEKETGDKLKKVSSEEPMEVPRKKILGLKRMRKIPNRKVSPNLFSPIDTNRKESKPKNIKINININVNNNSNNTLNITSFNSPHQCKKISKIIDDESDDEKLLKNIQDIQMDNGQNIHTSTPTHSMAENNSMNIIEDMKESINQLLRFKIDMPTSASNRYIISSLEKIEEEIKSNATCCTYKLTKELLPVLTSFLSNKNQTIFIKSSEILERIKDKILNEIFEYDEKELLSGMVFCSSDEKNFSLQVDEFIKELEENMNEWRHTQCDKQFSNEMNGSRSLRTKRKPSEELHISRCNSTGNLSSVYGTKQRNLGNDKENQKDKEKNSSFSMNTTNENKEKREELQSQLRLEDSLSKTESLHDKDIAEGCNLKTAKSQVNDVAMNSILNPGEYLHENFHFNSVNLNINPRSNLFTKTKSASTMKSLSTEEMDFLFNGFINKDSFNIRNEQNLKENLETGVCFDYFYQKIYSKFNGLDKKQANKRKHVCLKLLSILKIILPEIDPDVLKKAVVFLEYNFRMKDPTLGSKYRESIENIYARIKETLSLTPEGPNIKEMSQRITI